MPTVKVNSASTVAEIPTLQGIMKQEEKVNYYKELFFYSNCYEFHDFSYLCTTNSFNIRIYAKITSHDKEAAYGCKSRDFSTMVETVDGDRLSFIHPKNF